MKEERMKILEMLQDGIITAEEANKLIVETANPVKVVEVDDADTLYSRALEWLKLQYEEKAIVVLNEMIDKFPGDKRGWQKLTQLLPDRVDIRDTALKFGDKELTAIHAKKEKYVQTICNKLRSGNGNISIEKFFTFKVAKGYYESGYLHVRPEYDYPCFRELLIEGWENAKHIEESFSEIFTYIKTDLGGPYNKLLTLPGNMTLIAESRNREFIEDVKTSWSSHTKMGSKYKEERNYSYGFIIGNYVFVKWLSSRGDYDDTVIGFYKTEEAFTQSGLERIIDTYNSRRINNLCVRCGNKLATRALSEYNRCISCKLKMLWE